MNTNQGNIGSGTSGLPGQDSIRNCADFVEDVERLSAPGLSRKQAKIIRKEIYDTIDARVRNFAAWAAQSAIHKNEFFKLQMVISFLNGDGPLEGYHFGERNDNERGPFWWRRRLAAAWAPFAARVSRFATSPEEPSAPTDISTRLRAMVASLQSAKQSEIAEVMLTAASECERFYGGMKAWKETAQQKDRNIAEHYVRKDRIATPSPVQAQSDLMPKRAAFIAYCDKRGLETVEEKDAWGKRKFKHSHIEAMWEGWFNAPTAAPSQPVAAVPEARELIQPNDMAALARFYECAMDSESGGHDVPKEAMTRLAEIGLVQSKGFGRYQVTTFGDYVLGAAGAIVEYTLPLKTYAEYNEESRQRHLSGATPAQEG